MTLITWNPNDKSNYITLSNNNLTTNNTGDGGVRATKGKASGKWYWETMVNTTPSSDSVMLGVVSKSYFNGSINNIKHNVNAGTNFSPQSAFYGIYLGNKFGMNIPQGAGLAYGQTWGLEDTIGIALDMDLGTIGFYKNGVYQGLAFNIIRNYFTEAFAYDGGGTVIKTTNFGATPFQYEIPEGYLPYDYKNATWLAPIKNLIKSSNNIYLLSETGEWVNTGLTEPLTKADFETHGMDDLTIIPSEKWGELDEEFEIITWTDDLETEKFIEITTDPFSPLERLNQGDEFEVLTWSDSEETPELSLIVPDKVVRYLVSKDKYSHEVYRDSKWISINKSNILTEGMTKIELESIPQEVWSEWFESEAHKRSFDVLISIFSTELNTAAIRSLTVNYTDNEAPIILDAEIVPDAIHNEYATVNASVKDYEGDKIYFKAMVKKSGTEDFVQVSPPTGWYERTSSNTLITQSFNHPYFSIGLNELKLVVKDERGAESEWVGNITYLNTNPTIVITHDDTQMTAVIGDEDGDDVAYRLSINGVTVFDYTEFFTAPTELKYFFDSNNLKFGQSNSVVLEVKDSHGGEVSEEINVVGTYRGLMFKNDAGKYFVDDHGNILMDLLFDSALVGGQISPTKKVTLENRNGFAIKNTKVNVADKNFTTGAIVEISETEMPFTPIDIINIPGVMANLGKKDFYVRVRTDKTAQKGGHFFIDGKADPVS